MVQATTSDTAASITDLLVAMAGSVVSGTQASHSDNMYVTTAYSINLFLVLITSIISHSHGSMGFSSRKFLVIWVPLGRIWGRF